MTASFGGSRASTSAPDWRRRGVFRALYAHVRAAASAAGAGGLRLYVEHDNLAAQETYVRVGMRRTGYLVMEEVPLRTSESGETL